MMLIVSIAVGAGAYVAYPRVAPVFLANPWLNGTIILVFIFGVLACVWQVLQLISSVSWIEDFATHRPGHELMRAPRLLAPLAALLRSRGARMQIGPASSRSILDSVGQRIDEARDITRYVVNLLIFLGLLGTFYGLATTVPAVVDTIRSLAPAEGESSTAVFARLIGGLEQQLSGMGTAFASSLLGLAGSLVVGLLELFASHGQNRFYRELEEWLSTITRVGFSSGDAEGGAESAGVVGVMADQMAEQLDALHSMLRDANDSRAQVDQSLTTLAASIERLTTRLDEEVKATDVLTRIADGQERLISSVADYVERPARESEEVEAEMRMRLRSLDVQLLRLTEELGTGRAETTTELRKDLARLTRVIEQAAGLEDAGHPDKPAVR
ncbi:biopolymer transporter ExbB [Qingshengfaniella alkalisoli]|nr:biopolymer transporter ExbB [Qingshengfaniella alkalisoli]